MMEIEAELSRIIINEMSDQQIIVLKERDGERSFPIVIGIVEIFAIDRRLKGIKPPEQPKEIYFIGLIGSPNFTKVAIFVPSNNSKTPGLEIFPETTLCVDCKRESERMLRASLR